MPPRKKSKTSAEAVDRRNAAEAGDTGLSDAANTISHTSPVDVTGSSEAAAPTGFTGRSTCSRRGTSHRLTSSIQGQ